MLTRFLFIYELVILQSLNNDIMHVIIKDTVGMGKPATKHNQTYSVIYEPYFQILWRYSLILHELE